MFKIVGSSAQAGDPAQVIMPAFSRPLLISGLGGTDGGTIDINNQRIEVDDGDTFNLDKNSFPECIEEQWLIVFTNITKWSVAWDTRESR